MPRSDRYWFHAFDVSYFSAKVRTALRYKGVFYEEVRADFREIAERTGLGFIPMLITPEDETWQDSTEIFDQLEARHPSPPLFPTTPLQRIAAHLVELYTDEFALIPAMHYRWGTPERDAMARARFIAMIGSTELGNAAGDRMAAARLAVGASDAAGPAIEDHTRDLLDALSAHFEGHPYLLGDRLSFADCSLMGPLYAHLFVDLESRGLLLRSATPVVGWIERCNVPNASAQGDWPADDSLAPTLREVLGVMGRDAAPVILEGLQRFDDWADSRPEDVDELPRAVGRFAFTLRGAESERFVGSYAPWLVQRVLGDYAALDGAARARVDTALSGTGWEAILAHTPRHRIAKKGFQLVIE